MKRLNLIVAVFLGVLTLGLVTPMAATAGPKKAHPKFKAKKHSPPPQAVAHGYKHKLSNGTVLTFDKGLGVYAVEGKPGFYYRNGLYIKIAKGVWQVSAELNGTWRGSKDDEVPENLKQKNVKIKTSPAKGKKK